MKLTLPEQVDAILSKLRSAIRRYVLLRGLAVLLTTLVLVFWVTLFVDFLWFKSTKLELPQAARLAIIIAGLSLIVVVLFQTVIWQLLVQLKRRALALLLEKHFPELNDRLITAVETAEQIASSKERKEQNALPELTRVMLAKTLQEASQITESLDIKEVFNPRPIKKAAIFAGIAILSIAATAAASPQTFSHWSKAYVNLSQDYWDHLNGLNAYLLAQPGDRVRQFEDRLCKHAAGADLTIIVETKDGKQTPDSVYLSYRSVTGARIPPTKMSPAGEGKFRYTIGNLVDDIEFHITGGDFTTSRPYQVITVPEPSLKSLTVQCNYPDYTNWNSPGIGEETSYLLTASQLTIPIESELLLISRTTKPITEANISGRDFELKIKKDAQTGICSGLCKFIDERGVTIKQVHLADTNLALIDETGYIISIPFFITQRYQIKPDTKLDVFPNIPIHKNESLRIYLEDTDGIINLEPARLQIHGIEDESPEVHTRLTGIGKSITRKAFLPMIGEVRDDYGLAELHFEYRLNQEKEHQSLPLERQPQGEQVYIMQGTESAPKPRFDVLPLELKLDDILYVSLVASDNDNLNGPHITRGETSRLKIVSDEELLSNLHQDELNLRKRFEQLIEELTRSRDDLANANTKAEKPADDDSESSLSENRQLVAESTQRTLNTVRKDKVDTDAIRAAFEDLREEMVNNRLDTPQVRRRLDNNIIEPLTRIIAEDFATAEEHLRLFDYAFRENSTPQFTAAQCITDIDLLLTNLRQVLLEMRKLENFQEVIELLKAIIDDEKDLRKKTEDERKKKLIDLLN